MAIINPSLRQPCPAVSVIIPLYNAEKYIGECLDSVLAQTFQNYEVIVVDDCSTDNSCAIVESYFEKFGGRLILSHMDTNYGSGAMPRNRGMNLSQGEYMFFLDNDDMITKTALEELYTIAKNYDADVVYCEKHYIMNDDGKGIHIVSDANVKLVDAPTWETDDLTQRIQKINQFSYRLPQWRKFVRRRLIFEYEIFFPNTRHGDDVIWTYALVTIAKKFLHVPNAVYIYRQSAGSIMRTKRTPQETVAFWLNPSLTALKSFDNLLGKAKLSPHHRYVVLASIIQLNFSGMFQEKIKLTPVDIYETIKQEFSKDFGEQDVLISALCTIISIQQKMLSLSQQKFDELAKKNQRELQASRQRFNELAAQVQQVINGLEQKN